MKKLGSWSLVAVGLLGQIVEVRADMCADDTGCDDPDVICEDVLCDAAPVPTTVFTSYTSCVTPRPMDFLSSCIPIQVTMPQVILASNPHRMRRRRVGQLNRICRSGCATW